MPKTLRLKEPIQTHDKQITQITFRDPSGADVFTMPLPYRTVMSPDADRPPDAKGDRSLKVEMVSDPHALKRWLVALAQDGVGEDVLVAVPGRQIRAAYDWLVNELTPDEDAEKNL